MLCLKYLKKLPKKWLNHCCIMKSSKRLSKYHLSIKILAEKRPYFPSPKILKKDRLSNEYISSFHQLFDSKKDRISHHQNNQSKNFLVISKVHLSVNVLAQKIPYFSSPNNLKQEQLFSDQ